MKYLKFKLIISVIILYWLVTLFFVFPNNPLNLEYKGLRNYFSKNFYQQWGFFAPPPNYNQRVYLIFKNRISNQINAFELIAPVVNEKYNKAPFNAYAQTTDYIISSTLNRIESGIRSYSEILEFNKDSIREKIKDTTNNTNTEKIVSFIESSPEFKTITNYAKIIAKQNNIEASQVDYRFQFVRVFMPQFMDRYSNKVNEVIEFSNQFLPLTK